MTLSRLHKKLLSFIAVALFVPLSTLSAAIVVNEIAWMGTANSTNDEWIELYNNGSENTDLTGWTLSWDASSVSPRVLTLKGSIAAQGYYLLERTSDATLPAITADLVYVGSLSNSGEVLVLKNKAGTEVDRVNGGTDWKFGGSVTIGNNSTKETAQRTASGWITATGTPKALNVMLVTAPVESLTSPENIIQKDTTKDATAKSTGTDSSSAALSAHESPTAIQAIKIKNELAVSLGRDRIGMVHAPLIFSSVTVNDVGKRVKPMSTRWSFGDGTTIVGDEVRHTYLFPGEYVVVVNVQSGDATAVDRATVRVLPNSIYIDHLDHDHAPSDQYVVIKNNGLYEVNIGGWVLSNGLERYIFPADTIMLPKASVMITASLSKFSFSNLKTVILYFPDETTAHEYSLPVPVTPLPFATSTMMTTTAPTTLERLRDTLVGAERQLRFAQAALELEQEQKKEKEKKLQKLPEQLPLAAVTVFKKSTQPVHQSSSSIIIIKKQTSNKKSFLDRFFSLFN